MDVTALSHAGRSSSDVLAPSSSAFLALLALMSIEDDLKKLWARDDLSTKEKFDAYLDGYLMAFDPYPVCKRQLFHKNDVYALLLDFFAVGKDMNKATQAFISAVDNEFPEPGVSDDELRGRRIETALRTLAAIEETRAKIAHSDE